MISNLQGAIATIHSVNPANYTARVQLVEYDNHITEEFPILTTLSYKNQVVSLPKVGTPVLVLFIGDDIHHGFILGTYFSNKNQSKSQKDEYRINFQNSIVTIKETGQINLKANLTTIDGDLKVTGNSNFDGKVDVVKTISSAASVTGAQGVFTSGASMKDGTIDVQSVKYKELSKK